ncbi:MAG TPA: hemin uptake protein HemP [Casimicrobiaceae bacterium]|jgi:hemin uptake protein HemP
MASETASAAAAVSPCAAPADDAKSASMLPPRVVTSDALLRGDSQLAILHEQTVYFLRRTRLGKLILTK